MDGLLGHFLKNFIREGTLVVTRSSGRVFLAGDGTGQPVGVRFASTAAERRLMMDPELALGELYTDGLLTVGPGDIFDVIELGLRNLGRAGEPRRIRFLNRLRVATRRLRQLNNARRARRNVAHHYDIDARIYSMFLDSDLQYSCACFETAVDTLEDAQLAKKRRIAAKLAIDPGQRVLDIGCGWGGLALYLARYCEASVTGVTLSREQFAMARQRAVGRAANIDFRLQDYRSVSEKFDRVVSVGMFEHVGVGFFDTFFRKIADCLTDDGIALVHTIGRTDGPGDTNPWITKYIFPGGYIPAMSEVLAAIERAGLLVTDVEVLRLHYAMTLKAWRDRFMARRGEAAAIYDERFCRMWEFYLAASEASFRRGENVVFQFQLARKVDALPLTRDYMKEREDELRRLETAPRGVRLASEQGRSARPLRGGFNIAADP